MSDLNPEMQWQCHRVSQQAADLVVKYTLETFSPLGTIWEKVNGEWAARNETSDEESK